MMTCPTTLALTLLSLLPQNPPDEKLPTKLSATEVQSLNRRAKQYFDDWIKNDRAERSQDRDRTRAAMRRSEEALLKEWETRGRNHDILAFMGDVRAIFSGVFPFNSRSGNNEVAMVPRRDNQRAHGIYLPRQYRADTAARTIIVLPSVIDDGSRFMAPRDVFERSWRGTEFDRDTVFLMPSFPDGEDLDKVPDLSREGESVAERERIATVMFTLGQNRRELHLDTDRHLLDCGRGSSAFGLRFATYFPSLFAGIIVRHPTEVDRIRLESLSGIPILLVVKPEDEDSAAVAERIATTLNGFQEGSCTVLTGKGDYPYKESGVEIAAWAKEIRRNMYRSKVVLVPNRDELVDGYWVTLIRGEAVSTSTLDSRPRFMVEADRATNRITITATGISDYRLRLNDLLVDLDKEITIVANGHVTEVKRERQLNLLMATMYQRMDPNFLFVTEYAGSIKAAPANASGTAEDKQ